MHAFKEKDKRQVIFLVLHTKKKFIIHPEYFDVNNIFSHPFIQNIKHKTNMVQDLSIKMGIALKNRYWRAVSNGKYTKYNASLGGMVKHNTVDGCMRKTKLYYNQVG